MTLIEPVANFLWGPWTPWILLAAGILFTVWTRFAQALALTHGVAVIRGVYDDPKDPGAINHFQALSAALSATVGLGNIGGVALAIGMGGPGALFWIWIVGLFGMALKSVEVTLAMLYRNTDDPDNPHGGAMWVVHHVVGGKGGVWKPIARGIGTFFCITLLVSAFTGGNMFQCWNVAKLTERYFGVPRLAVGIVVAALVGAVIIGGIKRIGQVASKLVPFMCILYVLSALSVLAVNVQEIPSMLGLVVTSAFRPSEAGGAFLGATVGYAFMEGMKRSLFSNEAGQGSAPIAHAAAKTDEPAREGVVAGLEPFIDTLCVCTLTALVILLTGTWNREAIGDFGAEVELVPVEGNALAWDVRSEGDGLDRLPPLQFDRWRARDVFYLVGEVQGATRVDTDSNRVAVEAEIVSRRAGLKGADEEAGPEAPEGLRFVWKRVELKPADWDGTPSGLVLTGRGVYPRYEGANLTAHAFDREFPGLGKWLVTLAAWLFAFSTMISWSYYGEQGVVYMTGGRGVLAYKLLFLAGIVYAADGIDSAKEMINLMDLGTGAMLWSNIPIVLALGFLAVRSLNDYRRRLRAGEMPRHKAPPMADVMDGRDVE
ncbi:MAG TPA: alanine/glycine:cation symporter family protein [Planctomycetaceae bacterium]|nr:alanine/glycine:cation symporter family protein [Planctomycetaceae bacterium]